MKIQTQDSSSYKNIFVIAIIALTLLRSSKCSTEPCTDPSVIGDTRRTTTEDPGTCGGLCDNNIREDVWYRLDASNSGARMPESSVAVWHCGTYIPIWLKGAHPTADNPGPVTLPVCAQLRPNGPECDWTNQISVKRCYDGVEYFVYMLKKTPFCDMAYCSGNGINCANNGSWNDITQSCKNPPTPALDVNPFLSNPYISGTRDMIDDKGNYFQATTFNMKCTLTYTKQINDTGARYDVIFLSDGRAVYTSTLSSTQDPYVEMSETYLKGCAGQTVTCKVASYWKSQYPARSPYRTSNSFKFDIYFVDSANTPKSSLTIAEGTAMKLNVKTTFIITTPGCFNLPVGSTCYPYYTFLVSSSSLLVSVCTFRINATTLTSGDIWVSSIPDIGASGKTGNIYFQTNSDLQAQNSIFSSYKSNTIPVTINDPTPWYYGVSWGDPHVTPFNSNDQYDEMLVGDVLLLSDASKSITIHVQQWQCGYNDNGPIACTCGVIAREGNNVLSINSCGSSTLTERLLSDETNPGGTIRYVNSQYVITLPSGLIIAASVSGMYVNLDVHGNAVDNYDGLLASPRFPYSQCSGCRCSTDCEVFRVPASGSLFSYSRTNPPPCQTNPPIVPQCDCLNGASNRICTMPDNANLVPSTLPSSICKSSSTRRKRESSFGNQNHKIEARADHGSHMIEKRADQGSHMIEKRADQGSHMIEKRASTGWPTKSGITEQQATSACSSNISMSILYNLCVTRLGLNVTSLIQACVFDVQVMDDINFTPSTVAMVLRNKCGHTIAAADNGTKSSVQQEFVNNDCQCSPNGKCNNGQCTCNSGYTSDDCSVKQSEVPVIQDLVSATCDVRYDTCRKVYLHATSASSDLVCQLTNGTTVISLDMSPTVTGRLVTCNVPLVPVVPDKSVSFANYTVYVSISNGASMKFSNEMKFIIYDGRCVACDVSSGCSNTPTACNILGRCYDYGALMYCGKNNTDPRECIPSLSNTKWLPPNAKDGNQGSTTCSSSRPAAASVFLLFSYIIMKLIKENNV